MKAQLVVVQGKPEGKTIPLALPKFKIGRGEGCQLRPQSDLVSREHAEFEVLTDSIILRDLGSRNGTDVNGKKLDPNQAVVLKSGDLIKIGTLTFAISIEGLPVAQAVAAPSASGRKPTSLDDVSGDEIDAWLVSDESRPTPDRPSGVYGGDTMTMSTFNLKSIPTPAPSPAPKAPVPSSKAPTLPPPKPDPAPVIPPEPEVEEEVESTEDRFEESSDEDMGFEDLAAIQAAEQAQEAEFVDESNPFYVPKKSAPTPEAAKGLSKDSSDAAHDILRKMMERRRASKS